MTSMVPAKIVYAGDDPMNCHKTPMGEKSPKGSIIRLSAGNGNCSGKTFENPYDNSVMASV